MDSALRRIGFASRNDRGSGCRRFWSNLNSMSLVSISHELQIMRAIHSRMAFAWEPDARPALTGRAGAPDRIRTCDPCLRTAGATPFYRRYFNYLWVADVSGLPRGCHQMNVCSSRKRPFTKDRVHSGYSESSNSINCRARSFSLGNSCTWLSVPIFRPKAAARRVTDSLSHRRLREWSERKRRRPRFSSLMRVNPN